MTYIKPDPEMQEEQEDLIMSYLNADYMSTDTPLSPPSSASSSSSYTTGSPEKNIADDFMLDMNTANFLDNVVDLDTWATNNTAFDPCFIQQQAQSQQGVAMDNDLLSNIPLSFFGLDATANASNALHLQANFIQPFSIIPDQQQQQKPTSTTSLSDSEQPKKKRGRKKREPIHQSQSPNQPSLLAPKPLAPRPNISSGAILVKTEYIPSTSSVTVADTCIPIKSETATVRIPTVSTPTSITTPVQPQPTETKSSSQASPESIKHVQIQKRQERLIKNRAAALLSRKRKREHLTCLEDEKQILLSDNQSLNHKVNTLESRIEFLEKENSDLKEKLSSFTTANHNPQVVNIGNNKKPLINQQKTSKATGVVFMIILFSFALFTLPSRTADRLTVGGSSIVNKKQFPLIGSSSSTLELDYTSTVEQQQKLCQENQQVCHVSDQQVSNTTDLVLIDSVRPRDLQTWINHKLDNSKSDEKEIVSWSPFNSLTRQEPRQQQPEASNRHIYLYLKEYSQIAPMNLADVLLPSTNDNANDLPTLSLFSPYNQTADADNECDKYLQIDVQVLRSTVVKGQLLPLQQCNSASTLLDGMRQDLLTNNVTRFNQKNENAALVKRDKARSGGKRISRVLV